MIEVRWGEVRWCNWLLPTLFVRLPCCVFPPPTFTYVSLCLGMAEVPDPTLGTPAFDFPNQLQNKGFQLSNQSSHSVPPHLQHLHKTHSSSHCLCKLQWIKHFFTTTLSSLTNTATPRVGAFVQRCSSVLPVVFIQKTILEHITRSTRSPWPSTLFIRFSLHLVQLKQLSNNQQLYCQNIWCFDIAQPLTLFTSI